MSFNIEDIDERAVPDYPRMEYMPEGMYDLQVVCATYERREDCVFLSVLVLITGYARVGGVSGNLCRDDWAPHVGKMARVLVYIDGEETAAIALTHLEAMGLDDVREWLPSNGRPLSKEFPLAADRLKGKRFRAHRKYVIKRDGQLVHRLNIVRPLGGEDD